MDSGMVVVISITIAMVFTVFFVLFYDYVSYEWCDTLFKNNTVCYTVPTTLLYMNLLGESRLHKACSWPGW